MSLNKAFVGLLFACLAFGQGVNRSGGGGLSSLPIQVNGGAIGSATTLNLVGGAGLTCIGGIVAGTVSDTCVVDTSLIPTRTIEQSGTDNSCVPASGSATAYTCALPTTLLAYVNQMTLVLKPDVACTGSTSTTLNIDSLGAKRIFDNIGSGNPLAAQCLTTSQLSLVYDASLNASAGAWRIMSAGASSTAGLFVLANNNVITGATQTISSGGAGNILNFGTNVSFSANNISDQLNLSAYSGFNVYVQNFGLQVAALGLSATDLTAQFFGNIQTKTILTVATLPTCNGAAEGLISAVSNALAPTFLGTVVGGGTVHTQVYCDGTNWKAN